ncbi:MAG: hydantoinase/oxoprolinase family protein [Candidatus Tectimicrobiota bacterium]
MACGFALSWHDMGFRLGIDIGGTFTDFVLLDEDSGRVSNAKLPSTPKEPAQAFVQGIRAVLARNGIGREGLTAIAHGTTVATNALLEKKGGRTGLLTTGGFRDILEIRRHVRGQGQIYDLFFEPPTPLVPRHWRKEVRERLDARGQVLVPLDEADALAKARELVAEGVQAIAVVLLHAHLNGQHESRIKALIQQEFPDCPVSISCEVSPEMREYERTSTTVVDASLQPVVAQYIGSLETRLQNEGVSAPLRIMQGNGGVMPAGRAATRPVGLVASGPVAGVIGGMAVGQAAGFERVITMDMGGTSCDLCLVEEAPRLTTQKEVDGNPIRVPMFDLHVIGAGGGSLAWVDEGGALRVGPHSAGAEPGPVCYLRGGTEPTVTDANLVLGRLNPEYFLGGAMKLDKDAARAALQERIARRFALSVEEAAAGILRVVNAMMAENIKVVSVKQGYDPRDFALVAFGGAGPTHAGALLVELQVPAILIPAVPGTLSALGLLATDLRHDYVGTYLMRAEAARAEEVSTTLDGLEAKGRAELAEEGMSPDQVVITRAADMRYLGQAYEVTVPIEDPADLSRLVGRFHHEHDRLYAHSLEGAAVEFVALRLTALGRLARPSTREGPAGESRPPTSAEKGRRPVYFDEASGWVDCPIYERGELLAGNRLTGPAIIEQLDTTTILFPGQTVAVHRTGTLIFRSANASA